MKHIPLLSFLFSFSIFLLALVLVQEGINSLAFDSMTEVCLEKLCMRQITTLSATLHNNYANKSKSFFLCFLHLTIYIFQIKANGWCQVTLSFTRSLSLSLSLTFLPALCHSSYCLKSALFSLSLGQHECWLPC